LKQRLFFLAKIIKKFCVKRRKRKELELPRYVKGTKEKVTKVTEMAESELECLEN